MSQRPSPYVLGGGLNQSSAALAVPAGHVIAAMNYEPLAEGYGRVDGFERTDGRLPSESAYHTLAFEAGTVPLEQGDSIIGASSGATAEVLVAPHGLTGSWDDNDAAGTLVLVGVSGEFEDGESIKVGLTTHATTAGPSIEGGAPSDSLAETWTEAAQTWVRELVEQVPGSGPVRGVMHYGGDLYAVRDNAGATAGRMFKASATGWVLQAFGRRIAFTSGLVEIEEGQTVNGQTSGATAIVERVIRRSGSWGSNAAGYLVLSAQVGTFAAETLRVGATAVATIGGNSAEIALPPGGRYASKVKNFYGAAALKRLYFVNGVGYAHEWDGAVLCPIVTGMEDSGHADAPSRIFEIANHLGLVFPGGSVQFSATGEPLIFNPLLGAGEFGLGDDCTDVRDANDSAVIFWTAGKVLALTGRDSDSFALEEITEESGADAWTVQRIGSTVYLDRRGLRDLSATSAFGNFKAGALSQLFEPYLKAKRKAGAAPVLSFVSRAKTHYRLVWDDGTGFTVYMGGKKPEMLPFELGGVQPRCVVTADMDDGSEGIWVGADDGFVYRLDSGTSHDGEAIRAFIMLPFNHLGSIRQNKRFHGVDVELIAAPTTRIGITAQFDYGNGSQPASGDQDFSVAGGGHDFIVQGGGGVWDASTWNDFYWSAAFEGTAQAYIDGQGRNVSLIIAAQSGVLEEPHTLQAYTIYWSPRGMARRVA